MRNLKKRISRRLFTGELYQYSGAVHLYGVVNLQNNWQNHVYKMLSKSAKVKGDVLLGLYYWVFAFR